MSVLRHAGLFAVIVVVLVGGAAVAPYVAGGDATRAEATNEQFQPDRILAEQVDESGQVTMDSTAENKTVLVDMGHENDVSESELKPLVSALVANGHEVQFYTRESGPLNESLREADAFLVVNPRRPYQPAERDGVAAFTRAGGRVLLMSDPPTAQISGGLLFASFEEVSYKQTALGSPFGVAFGSGSLYNMAENQHNFESIYATSRDAAITEGVDRVVFREATPVVHDGGTVGLVTTEGTTLSTTRDTGTYPTLVQSGNVVAVGDTDFVHPEDAYDADNEVLVGNLADFLVSGDKEPGAPKKPGSDRRPPSGPSPPPTRTASPA
jgi:hypothetical protein